MPAAPARHAPARRTLPRPPARRPAPAGKPRKAPQPAPKRSQPRGAAVLDALLHGRAWIALVFALLAGIVFFNVDLLRMNREIASNAASASDMKRDNARLRALTARLGSSERIQEEAARAGLVLPAPGEVRYLRTNPSVDGANAAKRLEADPGLAAAPVAVDPVVSEPVVPAEPPAVEPVAVEPVAPVAVEPVEPVAVDPVVQEVVPTVDPVTGVPVDPATGAPAG